MPPGGGGSALFATVTVTPADVLRFPAASRATAVSVWLPSFVVVVFHAPAYGALVTSVPRLVPSSSNCTPTTPTLSAALADTFTVPETVAPPAGAVIEIVGGVMSEAPLVTVTLTA